MNRRLGALAVCSMLVLAACGGRGDSGGSSASGDCDPGITDDSIKIGASLPMSGAGAVYGALARTTEAYFEDVNAAGGVEMGDGKTRKVEFVAKDDAYDPARTVSNVRSLVEQDGVFGLMEVLGTSPNLAIGDYVAGEGIPNLMAQSGTDEFMDQDEKWTMGYLAQYDLEARVLADYVISEAPDAKVGLIYQNDGFGKNMLADYEKHFEGTGVEIVESQSYEQAGSSVDSQVVNLANSGADVFISYATGTFMTQALKKAHDIGWKPRLLVTHSGSSSAKTIMQPAGPGAENAVTISWLKDPTDQQWADDAGVKSWKAFAKKHSGSVDVEDSIAGAGYTASQTMHHVLENMDGCTRQDMLDAAQSLDESTADLFLPGVSVSTTPDYPYFVTQVQKMRFDGTSWHPFGDVESATE